MCYFCRAALVRYTVGLVQARIVGSEGQVGSEPLPLTVGACSEPAPSPRIRDLPLLDIDIARYLLAEAEVAAGIDAGITASLEDRLEGGPIVAREIFLGIEKLGRDIARTNAESFVGNLRLYVESMVYWDYRQRQGNALDSLSLERGRVPESHRKAPFDSVVEQAAREAIMAFCVVAAMEGENESIGHLERAMQSRFGGTFPGKAVFDFLAGGLAEIEAAEETVLRRCRVLLEGRPLRASDFLVAGICFFQRAERSHFKRVLIASLAGWQRAGWDQITETERFGLRSPALTVPGIRAVLGRSAPDRVFLAGLILAAADAVEVSLGSYRDDLRGIAGDA